MDGLTTASTNPVLTLPLSGMSVLRFRALHWDHSGFQPVGKPPVICRLTGFALVLHGARGFTAPGSQFALAVVRPLPISTIQRNAGLYLLGTYGGGRWPGAEPTRFGMKA